MTVLRHDKIIYILPDGSTAQYTLEQLLHAYIV